ncbi:MAG: hypothetical protein WAK93_06955 [Solirubrobacteraceae bacterium]
MVFECANGSQAPVAYLRTPTGIGEDRPAPTGPRLQSPPGPPTPPRRHAPADWRADLTAISRVVYDWALRPRVRLTLIGILLLLMGGVIVSNSVWTLPLMIVGALMVGIAWIGHRLKGRFTLDWGEAGAELAFNATVKAPTHARRLPAGDVIESEAHTVEIDVSELKALIAAADAQADIRVKRVARDRAVS